MTDLDLNKVQTPEGVMTLLGAAVEQFRDDAGNLEATCFMDNKPWLLIAGELEEARERIERGLKKLGYPSSQAQRVPLGEPRWSKARYPGDTVRIVHMSKGDELGSIRIQDQSGAVKHPAYNYKIGMFLPGEVQSSPGDTPKVWPERHTSVAERSEANAKFDQYVKDATAEGWIQQARA